MTQHGIRTVGNEETTLCPMKKASLLVFLALNVVIVAHAQSGVRKVPPCPHGSEPLPTWQDHEGHTRYVCRVGQKQSGMDMCVEWEGNYWSHDVRVPCGSSVSSATDEEYARITHELAVRHIPACPANTEQQIIVISGNWKSKCEPFGVEKKLRTLRSELGQTTTREQCIRLNNDDSILETSSSLLTVSELTQLFFKAARECPPLFQGSTPFDAHARETFGTAHPNGFTPLLFGNLEMRYFRYLQQRDLTRAYMYSPQADEDRESNHLNIVNVAAWLKASGRNADFLAFDAKLTADAIRDAEARQADSQ